MDVSLTNSEEAGYQFEKGRQRAQAEQSARMVTAQVKVQPKKKRKTWLWVLGWLCIFPIPLTILMLNSPRTKKIDRRIRIGVVVGAWVLYLIIACCGQGSTSSNKKSETKSDTAIEQTVESDSFTKVNAFIERFNSTSGLTITDTKEYTDIQSDNAEYRRDEFRLRAYKNAVAKVGTVTDYGRIEIVGYGGKDHPDIRVYAYADTKEKACLLFEKIANVLVTKDNAKENIANCVKAIDGETKSGLYLGASYDVDYQVKTAELIEILIGVDNGQFK